MVHFTLEQVKSKKASKALQEMEVGGEIQLTAKGFFSDDDTAKRLLGLDDQKLASLNKTDFIVALKEVNERIPAEMNTELFDKLYEPGTVKTKADLEEKIKTSLKAQFEPQANQKLMNDISEALVEKTKFKLPDSFLKKWIQTTAKEPLTEEAAEEEYNKSEKGIRYQLIEGKIINENQLSMTFDELKEFTANLVKNQMMQYGQIPEQEQLDGIVSNVLSNQEETKRISEQLMGDKMLQFYLEKAPLKNKKIAFDAFVKEAYGKA